LYLYCIFLLVYIVCLFIFVYICYFCKYIRVPISSVGFLHVPPFIFSLYRCKYKLVSFRGRYLVLEVAPKLGKFIKYPISLLKLSICFLYFHIYKVEELSEEISEMVLQGFLQTQTSAPRLCCIFLKFLGSICTFWALLVPKL